MIRFKREKDKFKSLRASTETELSLQFADQGIKAGFPSPAQDYIDMAIDLKRS